MIKIIFTLTDKQTEKEYEKIDEELIMDDFVCNFEGWKKLGYIEVKKYG